MKSRNGYDVPTSNYKNILYVRSNFYVEYNKIHARIMTEVPLLIIYKLILVKLTNNKVDTKYIFKYDILLNREN